MSTSPPDAPADHKQAAPLGPWLAAVLPFVLLGLVSYKLFLAYVSNLFGGGRYLDHLLTLALEDFVGFGITATIVVYMALHRDR